MCPVTAVFTEEMAAKLEQDFPEVLAGAPSTDLVEGYLTGSGPECTLVLAEHADGTDAVVVTHTAERTLAGVIVTDGADAVQWTERRFEAVLAESEPYTVDAD
jgi:hypothetical protein